MGTVCSYQPEARIMPKLNREYKSFIEYILNKIGHPYDQRDLFRFFDTSEYAYLFEYDESGSGAWEQIRGAFQPLADMWKDVKDTFKPYKSSYHIKRDAMQPLRGIGNIGVAVLSSAGGIVLFIVNTIRYGLHPNFWVNM